MIRPLAAIVLAGLLAACAAGHSAAPAQPASLYQRLGGTQQIDLIVDSFIYNIIVDDTVRPFFEQTSLLEFPRLKFSFVQQICEISGGPCQYKGPDMVSAHKGMNIPKSAFNAMGRAMKKALDRYGIDPESQRELLSKMAAMGPDIIGQ